MTFFSVVKKNEVKKYYYPYQTRGQCGVVVPLCAIYQISRDDFLNIFSTVVSIDGEIIEAWNVCKRLSSHLLLLHGCLLLGHCCRLQHHRTTMRNADKTNGEKTQESFYEDTKVIKTCTCWSCLLFYTSTVEHPKPAALFFGLWTNVPHGFFRHPISLH